MKRIALQSRKIHITKNVLHSTRSGFEPADDTPSPEEQFFENERKKAIKQLVSKAMQELTEKQRIVVYKTFWEEKTLRQVGLELGIDNKTVYEILEAAKGKMKKFLKFF